MTTYRIQEDRSEAHEWRAFGTARMNGFTEGVADDRPPLVLLHGLTFDHRMWLPVVDALRRHDPGRRVLVLDLPGHGASPMIPISVLDDVAAAVATAVDDAGLGRPVIVGHSISGVVAAIYGTTYPTSGLVDVDQELDPSFIRLLQSNRDAIIGPGFAQIWPGILASMRIDLVPEDARHLLDTGLPRQEVVLAYWNEALETPLPTIERRINESVARARETEVPVLIVAGHQYDATYSAWLRRSLPRARVTVVPGSGHFPHLADPDRFARLLADTGQWRSAPVSATATGRVS